MRGAREGVGVEECGGGRAPGTLGVSGGGGGAETPGPYGKKVAPLPTKYPATVETHTPPRPPGVYSDKWEPKAEASAVGYGCTPVEGRYLAKVPGTLEEMSLNLGECEPLRGGRSGIGTVDCHRAMSPPAARPWSPRLRQPENTGPTVALVLEQFPR